MSGILAVDFPEVHLRVMIGATQGIENWLLDRQADIGVVVAPARSTSLIQERILTEDMYLVGRERLSWMGDGAVPVAVLRDLPLVLPLASYGSRRLIDIATSSLGFTLEPQIEIDGPHIMTELVRSGGLYTVMPARMWVPDLRREACSSARYGGSIADKPKGTCLCASGSTSKAAVLVIETQDDVAHRAFASISILPDQSVCVWL